mmetsp:Transcript_3001/g.5561  ORF Transcript_3001/g.5561 Transcript_3001/m.5561 type:complete len:365 (+) Transcript_3001:212-1306(+)
MPGMCKSNAQYNTMACLEPRCSIQNGLTRTLFEVLEVLIEKPGQLLTLLVVGRLISPSFARVQDFRRNLAALLWNLKVEHWQSFVLGLFELAVVDAVDDGTGVLQRKALALSVGSAGPSGVDEPAVGAMLRYLLCKQLRVFAWMPHEERSTETCRESRGRLLHTLFGTCDLGSVAAHEVVHSLLWRQLRDWRQDSKSVAGEHDDVLRHWAYRRNLGVVDVVDRVGQPRVLGERAVFVVDVARNEVVLDVFEHGAELGGVEDLWLLVAAEVDGLGVAASLDVEHSVVSPDVLVVANEQALWVARKRGLSGSREAEEDADVAVFALVGTCVHRQHALLGHEVVEDCEDTFLHFSGVLGTENDHFLL